MNFSFFSLFCITALHTTIATAQISKAKLQKNAAKIEAMQDPNYTIIQQKVLLKPAYTGWKTTNEQYAKYDEQVIISPAHDKDATMQTVIEHILVKPQGKRLEVTPAEWQSVTKTILIKETCNSERPETKTYIEQVLVAPETTRDIEIPAEYKTITKAAILNDGNSGVQIPAQYRTITKIRLERASTVLAVEYPAEYQVFEIKKCKFPNSENTMATITKIEAEKIAAAAALQQVINDAPVPQQVLLKPPYTTQEPQPVQYHTTTEQILLSMEHHEGALMKTVSEQIKIKDAAKKIEIIPAVWLPVAKTIVTKPACKGRPQETKSYIEQVLVTPEKMYETEIPAEYKTFFSQIVVSDDGTGQMVPGQYQTITKLKVDSPASVRTIEYAAEYQTFEIEKCK
jgi:hypothetical protein